MDIKKKRIVFMGTPQFAVPSLIMLISKRYNVVAVYTQLDKQGNRMQVLPSPIKALANCHNIPVLQFDKIKSPEGVQSLKDLQPDIVITAAFGQLLTQTILDIPTLGVYNVHASLLPQYRGGCPIHWCIIEGNHKSGITIMRTERGLDTGPILLQVPTEIESHHTYDDIYTVLSQLGATALEEFLNSFDQIVPQPQQDSISSYHPIIRKQDGKCDWTKSSIDVHNHIRGVTSTPGAYTYLNGQLIKIWRSQVSDLQSQTTPGQILYADSNNGLVIGCGSGCIKVLELQLSNKKKLSIKDFFNGNKLPIGSILGG
ncbi:MAG: methionyl-tRNA formyltransferase [Clostridiales bacterium]|jgi:methionyl-tRNA formyltransferase|nr:methionyl-tRNA formyltransferase [Clostridiales bacterium]